VDWLGGLSRQRLRAEFVLQSPLLEETTRAIFLSSLNPCYRMRAHSEAFCLEKSVYTTSIQTILLCS
jgi:hypothetical protein